MRVERVSLQLSFRTFLAAVCLGTFSATLANAQPYPNRPVTIIVPFAAGGSGDLSARIVAEELGNRLGQNFIIANRPGAAGNIGYAGGAKSIPDGYTLTWAAQTLAVNPSLYPTDSYDARKDFIPISQVVAFYQVLTASPEFPYKTLAEFIIAARGKPNSILFASGGYGGAAHLAMEALMNKEGLKLTHVPFAAEAPSMTGLMSNQISLAFLTVSTVAPQLSSGKLRALGIASPKRLAALPNVPAIAEAVPGYSAQGWFGLLVPTGTPKDVVDLLGKTVQEVTRMPQIKKRLEDLAFEVIGSSSSEFANVLNSEYDIYRKLITEQNIKAQ